MSKRDLWGDRHPDCPERQQLHLEQDFATEEDNNFGSQSQLLGSGHTGNRGGRSDGGLASTTAASGAQGPVINLRLEPLASTSLSLGRGLSPACSEQYLGGSSAALATTATIAAGGLGTTPGAVSAASLAANTSASRFQLNCLYFPFCFIWKDYSQLCCISSICRSWHDAVV